VHFIFAYLFVFISNFLILDATHHPDDASYKGEHAQAQRLSQSPD
jgi:hypothetical protein